MRIIYISDVHGHFDALAKLPKADLLVVGGDFTQFGSLADFREAVAKVSDVAPAFLGVSGNLDLLEGDAVLAEGKHLLTPEDVTTVNGVRLLGVSGGNTSPFGTPYEWKDEDMFKRLAKWEQGSVDILVSHTPPFESGADVISSGISVGSKAIADFVQRVQPKIVLCGHIHEARGIYSPNGIPVVNPGPFGDEGNFAEILLEPNATPSAWFNKAIK